VARVGGAICVIAAALSSTERSRLLARHKAKVIPSLVAAGRSLAARQVRGGGARGNVPPWPGSQAMDFHGTLASIWLWSRAQLVSGLSLFGPNVGAAWGFIEDVWDRFVPNSLDADAGLESAYDCAMILRAGLATHALAGSGDWRRQGDMAGRLLAGYLADIDIDDSQNRGFSDPGFVAWNLADYADIVRDRGMAASAGRFVDKVFGTRLPGRFADEPAVVDGLFDFSSTLSTRVLSVIAVEGDTPFVGSWLRERVAPALPRGWVCREHDEQAWNACVAIMAGRAFLVSTDDRFLKLHDDLLQQLVGRARSVNPVRTEQAHNSDAAKGAARGVERDTMATFYYAMALDSMLEQG